MSKVLIVTNHSYMLYRFRKELIEALLVNNEVVISTPFVGHQEDFKHMGCRLIETDVNRRGINPTEDIKLLKTYLDMLKKEKPDKVITYSIKPNIYMGLACKWKKIPYYVNVQGLGTAFQNKKLAAIVTILYKTALKKAGTVFFENTANAGEFIDRNILKESDITVLSGAGINLKEYKYVQYPESSEKHFLYLGRIMKEKGMDEFMEAAVRIKEEYGDKVVIDMVGFFEDEYKEKVESLADKHVINFYGFQKEPRPYYAIANCVVMPSYHEGLSNVLLEAEAMGRPVITSDIPGCRETVVDGKTGHLCEVKNADMLYEKMKQVMESTLIELKIMGMEARNFVEHNFNKEDVVMETMKALELAA